MAHCKRGRLGNEAQKREVQKLVLWELIIKLVFNAWIERFRVCWGKDHQEEASVLVQLTGRAMGSLLS